MSSTYDITSIVPGEYENLVLTDSALIGSSASSATLLIKDKESGTTVITKTITSTLNADGQITNGSGTATFSFILESVSTALLTAEKYVYSLHYTNNNSKVIASIPVGRIYPKFKA